MLPRLKTFESICPTENTRKMVQRRNTLGNHISLWSYFNAICKLHLYFCFYLSLIIFFRSIQVIINCFGDLNEWERMKKKANRNGLSSIHKFLYLKDKSRINCTVELRSLNNNASKHISYASLFVMTDNSAAFSPLHMCKLIRRNFVTVTLLLLLKLPVVW